MSQFIKDLGKKYPFLESLKVCMSKNKNTTTTRLQRIYDYNLYLGLVDEVHYAHRGIDLLALGEIAPPESERQRKYPPFVVNTSVTDMYGAKIELRR